MNTYLATACAVLAWMSVEWIVKGKPSMLGAASGAVLRASSVTRLPRATLEFLGRLQLAWALDLFSLLGCHWPEEDD